MKTPRKNRVIYNKSNPIRWCYRKLKHDAFKSTAPYQPWKWKTKQICVSVCVSTCAVYDQCHDAKLTSKLKTRLWFLGSIKDVMLRLLQWCTWNKYTPRVEMIAHVLFAFIINYNVSSSQSFYHFEFGCVNGEICNCALILHRTERWRVLLDTIN